jgi:hypothetical protein
MEHSFNLLSIPQVMGLEILGVLFRLTSWMPPLVPYWNRCPLLAVALMTSLSRRSRLVQQTPVQRADFLNR